VVSFTPQLLYLQGKSPQYQLDRRLDGPQLRSGCGGEEKNSQTLPGLELPIIQLVTQCCTASLPVILALEISVAKLCYSLYRSLPS